MEESRNTEAIVLKIKPYRENDSLITVYSKEYGLLELLAKSIRKQGSKLAGHLNLLQQSKILIINGKGFDYLSAASSYNSFLSIREDYDKIICAQEIVKIFLSQVKENQKEEDLFFLLENYFQAINDDKEFSSDKSLIYKLKFILSFIKINGYLPELFNCIKCKKKLEKGKNYFDFLNGGVLCSNCYENIRNKESSNNILTINDKSVILLRYFLNKNISKKVIINKKKLQEIYKIAQKFLLFIN